MAFKAPTRVSHLISAEEKTVVKFDENEFTVLPVSERYGKIFYIQDIKGDFEILSVEPQTKHDGRYLNFSKDNNFFCAPSNLKDLCSSPTWLVFTIYTDVKCKKKEYNEKKVKLFYNLWVSADRIKVLSLHDYFEETIIMSGYEHIKLKYYIKRILEDKIEVFIENPFDIEIGNENLKLKGSLENYIMTIKAANSTEYVSLLKTLKAKKGNFKHEEQDTENIDLKLFFIFDPLDFKTHETKNAAFETSLSHAEKDIKCSTITNQKLYEILSDTAFSDVVLYSSEQIEIRSHRCVLAKYSDTFKKIFEESNEIPVKINIEEFNADIIKATLDFCYGKSDAIKDRASKLLDFANKYSLKELKDACCYYCNEQVDASNVCEVIQIAYSNNLEELKQKCKHIMTEKKAEIDQGKLKSLPKDILFDVFCTF